MTDIATLTQAVNERLNNATGTRVRREEMKAIFEEIITYLDSLDAIGLAPELVSLIGLANAANKGVYFSAEDTFSLFDLTAYGRSLAGVADEAALKALINAEAGVDFQAHQADLAAFVTAITGLTLAPPILTRDVAISSAEILQLHATPKELVPAPGANKFIQFLGATLFLDYNSAAYAAVDAADNFTIAYASGEAVVLFETDEFLIATSDQYLYAPHYGLATAMEVTPGINSALNLSLAGAVTTGNSPIGVRIQYRIVDVSTLSAT